MCFTKNILQIVSSNKRTETKFTVKRHKSMIKRHKRMNIFIVFAGMNTGKRQNLHENALKV